MKLKRVITIHLFFLVFSKPVRSFSINSQDKIALEQETVVISDRQLYLPLGWSAKISCEGASKLKDINVIDPKNLAWIIRYPNNGAESKLDLDNTQGFDIVQNFLRIKRVLRSFDRVVLECHIHRDGNTSLVSRNRIDIQDCISKAPPDTIAYNLHNPCAFGQCTVKKTKKLEIVGCTCFRQYSGKHCHIAKPSSWILDFLPYSMVGFVFIIYVIFSCILPHCTDDRKQEKLMAISQLVGYSDRNSFKLSKLYPFIKKLRRCNFPDPDEGESKAKKYRKLQRKYQKLKERAAGAPPAAAPPGPVQPPPPAPGATPVAASMHRTVTLPTTGTGMTTGTTGTITGASTMNTVSGTLPAQSARADPTQMDPEEGFHPVASKRTNKKKGRQNRRKRAKATIVETSSDGRSTATDGGTTTSSGQSTRH